MSGRALLIVVTGVIIISSVILHNVSASSTKITANFNDYFLRQSAQNIAQSGVNLGLRRLVNDSTWRNSTWPVNMLAGKVLIRAFDTTFAGKAVTGVSATGTIESRNASSTAYVLKLKAVLNLNGVLTTNGPTGTAGSMVIDGRDHTISGALVPLQGVYGVWTTSTFSQGGGSAVGGTVKGVDYQPKGWPKSSKVIQMGWPTPGPTTPDSVFGGTDKGFPEGTLKSISQSGTSGSQYVTNPLALKYPLSGVTYVELPSGGSWSPATITGSGILIVHNSSRNAVLANTSGGNFTGIVISDDIVHINSIIIGATVALTSNPSQGNLIGNGNGQILYSNAAIKSAMNLLQPGGAASANVIAWWE